MEKEKADIQYALENQKELTDDQKRFNPMVVTLLQYFIKIAKS